MLFYFAGLKKLEALTSGPFFFKNHLSFKEGDFSVKFNKNYIFTICRIIGSGIILNFLYTFFSSFFKNKEFMINPITSLISVVIAAIYFTVIIWKKDLSKSTFKNPSKHPIIMSLFVMPPYFIIVILAFFITERFNYSALLFTVLQHFYIPLIAISASILSAYFYRKKQPSENRKSITTEHALLWIIICVAFFENYKTTPNIFQISKEGPKQYLTDSEITLNSEIQSNAIALVQIFKHDNFYDLCLHEKAASLLRTKLLKNLKAAKESSHEIKGSTYKKLLSENFLCLTYENAKKTINTTCGATFNDKGEITQPAEGIFKYVEEGKFFTPQRILPDAALNVTSVELNKDNKLTLKFEAIKRRAHMFHEIFAKKQHSGSRLEFNVDSKNSTEEITRGELRF